MSRNLHDIDKIFNDGLEDHAEPVPFSVWESVSNELDKKQAVHFREKYFRLRRLAVAMALLAIGSAAYLLYINSSAHKNISTAQQNVNSSSETVSAATASNNKPGKTIKSSAIEKPVTQPTITGKDGLEKSTSQAEVEGSIAKNDISPGDNRFKKTTIPGPDHSAAPGGNDNKNVTGNIAARKTTSQYNLTSTTTNGGRSNSIPAQNKYVRTHDHADEDNDNQLAETVLENNLVASSGDSRATNISNNKTITANWPWENFFPAPGAATIHAPALPADKHNVTFADSIAREVQLQTAIARAKNNAASIHRFSLTLFGAPNHSFTRLENDWRLSGPGHDKNEALRSEQQGSSFSAGILVSYGLSAHLLLQSGLVFSSATTNIAPKIIYAKPDNYGHARYELNCSSGYAYFAPKSGTQPAVGDSIKVMGSKSRINYIGVPVSLNYVIKAGKFRIQPGIGLSFNFLTGNQSATDFNYNAGKQKESSAISGLKSNYLDGSIGLGLEYVLGRRVSISVRPLMRWALSSINNNTPVKTYQNYSSLETGLKINL